jgi:hypothetical protein
MKVLGIDLRSISKLIDCAYPLTDDLVKETLDIRRRSRLSGLSWRL